MREAGGTFWLAVGLGLALAAGLETAPALAEPPSDAILKPRPSGDGAGGGGPILMLPRLFGGAIVGPGRQRFPRGQAGGDPGPGRDRPHWPSGGVDRPPPFVAPPVIVDMPAGPPRQALPRPSRRHAAPPPRPPRQAVVAARSPAPRALPPPPGETRFRAAEILVATSPSLPQASVAQILARHRLTEASATRIALLGVAERLWRIPDRREVAAVVRELGGEPALTRVQPNYVYVTQDDVASSATSLPQYALSQLHVDPALDVVAGQAVRVAVIDTAIDEAHPDLAGVVEARFDAIGDASKPRSLGHGTSIAGAIAAHGRLRGVAPSVRILSARAFDVDGAGAPQGSTLSLVKALDWAAGSKARVVNMSFAGPPDPTLRDTLAAALARNLTLVGAVGNEGPKAAPLYPAADPSVIAVTATDAQDRLYPKANVGAYVAVAAPGVDVLLPGPEASYTVETGTSISAALTSGVVALLIERRPNATPAEIRRWLTTTANPLADATPGEAGAGVVDARKAVGALQATSAK